MKRHAAIATTLTLIGGLAGASVAAAILPLPVTVTATPGSLDFGSQGAGTSASKSVVVTSDATVFLSPPAWYYIAAAPTLSGTGAAAFSVAPGTCVEGADITSGNSCTSTVTFTPPSPGSYSAALSIPAAHLQVTDGAPSTCSMPYTELGCVVTVALSGTAPTPPPPTVGVSITPALRLVRPGRTTTVTVTTTNTGTVVAPEVVTSAVMPVGFRVVSTDGGQVSGRNVQWALGSLDPGGTSAHVVTLRALGDRARTVTVATTATATGVATPATARGKVRVVVVKRRHVVVAG